MKDIEKAFERELIKEAFIGAALPKLLGKQIFKGVAAKTVTPGRGKVWEFLFKGEPLTAEVKALIRAPWKTLRARWREMKPLTKYGLIPATGLIFYAPSIAQKRGVERAQEIGRLVAMPIAWTAFTRVGLLPFMGASIALEELAGLGAKGIAKLMGVKTPKPKVPTKFPEII